MLHQFSDQLTYKINHQFACNKKFLVYLITRKKCLKHMLDKLLIAFDIVGIITKVMQKISTFCVL